jgi:predicted dehydrogenase
MEHNRFVDRRTFLKSASVAGAGLWASGATAPLFAYRGGAPNEKLVVAVMGVNGRGSALADSFARAKNAEVGFIVEVDEKVLAKEVANVAKVQGKRPQGVVDVRRVLDNPDVDALVIAAPDHWHAPATVMALKAGKHVYVEKPLGHNPAEGELLVAAMQKYPNLKIQQGNQQRSDPRSQEVIQAIHEGLIGRAYYARTWYANSRGPIGVGKPEPAPGYLNYELWQGPAPRMPYQDNIIHYHWHWFWNWGTGEICNNGTHEIDVARWALQADYPTRVTSAGGRYHYDDDWQFYDTQDAAFDFPGEKTIAWLGRSCNGFPIEGRGRGTSVHGTNGTVIMDRDGYVVYDAKNKVVREETGKEKIDALNTRGGDSMTDRHVENFIEGVRSGARLNSPMDEAHKSVLLCHLGNIAQRTGRTLQTDPRTGRIVGDDREAMAMWSREYAPGWKPAL